MQLPRGDNISYRTKRYRDFTVAADLLCHLNNATEIVTFNGRTYDLIALEKLLGQPAVAPLWRLPHHDLKGWMGQQLRMSISHALPKLTPTFDSVFDARVRKLLPKRIDGRVLGGTYRDTKFVHHLFDEYAQSGEKGFTFLDFA